MSAADDLITDEMDGIPHADLLEDLKALFIDAEAERPRSRQRQLGPSSVGHQCERHLGFALAASRVEKPTMEQRGPNKYSDPMASIIGTAMHSWIEEAARAANRRLGRTRWIPEQKVEVREGLAGTCDLFDLDTMSVLDWKFPGSTRFTKYSKHGPSPVYRGQAHLYGEGYRKLGLTPRYVGIVFVSRTGTLRQFHLWREPFSPALVDEVFDRYDRVDRVLSEEGVPGGFKRLPIAPGEDCDLCPWYSPDPQTSWQCGGQ